MKKILTALCAAMFLTSPVSAQEVVFNHDFENSTPGDLSDVGALGTPAVGTVSASGGFVSTIRPAYNSGSNGASNSIDVNFDLVDATDEEGNVLMDDEGNVIQRPAFTDQTVNDVGTPAGNFLTVNLSEPAAVTGGLGAGQTTTVDFNLASFGTNNPRDFKYIHIRGLSSNGLEVFQILWRAGSGGGTRQVFARALGEDNTTFANDAVAADGGVDGTLILSNVSFNINSINTDAAPGGQIGVSIVIDENGWNASAAPTGGASVETPAMGLSIASGAPDLASIVFFSSHNANVDPQNKGLWIDNVVVATDLTVEPTAGTLGDFNGDQVVDCADLDGYVGNIGAAVTPALAPLDIDNNGTITAADANTHITTLVQTSNGQVGTFPGDLNCDGQVNVLGDAFALVGNLNNPATSYSQGDINFDGTVNVLGDAFTLIGNLNNSNNP